MIVGTPRQTLVTGFPGSFLARRLVQKIVREEPSGEVVCVVPNKDTQEAEDALATLEPTERKRVSLLEGDTPAMDMGLSGKEFRALVESVQVIHHCAALTTPGSNRKDLVWVNVNGTREVLEVAENAARLERLVMWSTASVSGARRGYVLEDELESQAGFRSMVEETRFRAERMVRDAQKRVPTTILRPTVIVGDSRTGEIDRLDGPYVLISLMLNAPVDLRMPMLGRADVPLNVVPIDYVLEAGYAIANDVRSLGHTFHIVDPQPLTAHKVFELIAKATGRRAPKPFLPPSFATALLRAPGLEKLSQMPLAFLEQLGTEVVYDARGTTELLAGRGITCPRFEEYVETMVQFVRAQQQEKKSRASKRPAQLREEDDPLG